MKKITMFIIFAALLVASMSGAADLAAAAPATAAESTNATAWVLTHTAAIFAALLSVSELMALIPGLKGNGILDSIVKILKDLADTHD